MSPFTNIFNPLYNTPQLNNFHTFFTHPNYNHLISKTNKSLQLYYILYNTQTNTFYPKFHNTINQKLNLPSTPDIIAPSSNIPFNPQPSTFPSTSPIQSQPSNPTSTNTPTSTSSTPPSTPTTNLPF